MDSFKMLKNDLRSLGIYQQNSSQREKKLCIILSSAQFAIVLCIYISVIWYALFTAQTFREHAESFLYVSYGFWMLSWYTTFLWHKEKFGQIFADLDELLEKSKSEIPTRNCLHFQFKYLFFI